MTPHDDLTFLLNSARTSPPLREAVQRVEAHIAGLQQQVAALEAEAEAESNGFRLLMQRAEAAEAALADTRRALENVRGTLLGYWTDILEAEIQRLLALIGSVNDQESAQA